MSADDSEEKIEKDFSIHRQMTIVEAVQIVFEWIDKLEEDGISDS